MANEHTIQQSCIYGCGAQICNGLKMLDNNGICPNNRHRERQHSYRPIQVQLEYYRLKYGASAPQNSNSAQPDGEPAARVARSGGASGHDNNNNNDDAPRASGRRPRRRRGANSDRWPRNDSDSKSNDEDDDEEYEDEDDTATIYRFPMSSNISNYGASSRSAARASNVQRRRYPAASKKEKARMQTKEKKREDDECKNAEEFEEDEGNKTKGDGAGNEQVSASFVGLFESLSEMGLASHQNENISHCEWCHMGLTVLEYNELNLCANCVVIYFDTQSQAQ